MKSFYGGAVGGGGDAASGSPGAPPAVNHAGSYIGTRARVAVYDAAASAPYIEEIDPAPAAEFIDSLSARVFELARQRGGGIPYTVVREIAENLLHARFAEPIVSILDDGKTIRFSDQGPGIPDKERAVLPGYTTATAEMKHVIRGVGSGLPIVSDFLSVTGGRLSIEDNLVTGSVVTVSTAPEPAPAPVVRWAATAPPRRSEAVEPVHESAGSLFGTEGESTEVGPSAPPWLTKRQKQVLALVLESGSAGPSIVSRELGVGLSTAYRDLASLEDLGLIESDGGKRTLTPSGLSFLGEISTSY
jgi:hypothetical protein